MLAVAQLIPLESNLDDPPAYPRGEQSLSDSEGDSEVDSASERYSDYHNSGSEDQGPGESGQSTLPKVVLPSSTSNFRLGSGGMQAKADYHTPAPPPSSSHTYLPHGRYQ